MFKKVFFILFFMFFSILIARPFHLQWKFNKNTKLYIDKYTQQEILKNGKIVRRRGIKDLVVLGAIQHSTNLYPLTGIYRSYEADLNSPKLEYKLTQEEPLFFSISNSGIYIVPQDKKLPTIRDIPYFPQKKLTIGERWSHIGYEIFDFTPQIKVPVQVLYQIAGYETNHGIKCIKLLYNYNINHYVRNSYGDTPYRFAGYVYSTLWYDDKEETPVYTESDYDILMFYRDSTTIEYRGTLYGNYRRHKKYTGTDRLNLKKSIEKSIGPDKNISVSTNQKGVIISLGEIFFDYDSAHIKDGYKKRLNLIGKILQSHPEYEVIIEGHTDDLGSDQYNMRLSETRAKNVLKYFLMNQYLKSKQGSFIGLGENNPSFPNTNAINRQKNRRVDIIIKQE